MLVYPHIDPVALSIGPFLGVGPLRVHWYGIMYLIGFAGAWSLAKLRARRSGGKWTALDVDDLIFYCAMGVILGGRIGWCLVYGHDVIAADWRNALHLWDGGMSFHGGLIGVAVAALLFARTRRKSIADVGDFLAPLPGIGLLAGRLGNFINGELWGKPTDLPWGFLVPGPDGVLVGRHARSCMKRRSRGSCCF
jgi:phosphatidylglycerol---prolipoprotein diacylglyceryl transferase